MKWFVIFVVSLAVTEIIYRLFFSLKVVKNDSVWNLKNIDTEKSEFKPSFIQNKKLFENYSTKQLNEVLKYKFERQRLFNYTEEKIFNLLIEIIDNHAKGIYRINGQTSLGEILKCNDRVAYNAINSKRVDFLIIDTEHMPIAAIEANGTGHYQNNALERDEIKRAAIESAGIKYIALRKNENPREKLERELMHILTSNNKQKEIL
jgi:hypothetical protein